MSRYFFISLLLLITLPGSVHAAGLVKPPNNLGLSAYWTFDEARGLTARDSSGYGNTAPLSGGVSWTTGKRGAALTFASGSSFNIVNSSSLGVTGTITMSGWFYLTSCTANHIPIWKNNHYTFTFTSNTGACRISYADSSNWSYGTFGYFGDVSLNAWHHVVITKDAAFLVSIYVDGQLVDAHTFGSAIVSNTSVLTLGGTVAGDTTNAFKGNMDDVRIFRRALSSTEVTALYRQGETIQKPVTRSGLVGEWKFDEGTSTRARDTSGANNNGALFNAPTWVTGKHGKAVQLDGNTQYVSIPNATSLNNGSLTATAWFTLASDPDCDAGNNYRVFLDKLSGVTGWRVILEQDKSLQFDVGISGATSRSGGVGVGMQVGVPVFVTFTYDAATGDQKVWSNGVVRSTKANTPASIDTNSTSFVIGKGGATGVCPASGNGYTPGRYDDVRIYNRALSSTEIQALYKERAVMVNTSQNGKLTSGLVGLWSFDGADIQGTTAYDRSGSGNNGTITAATKTIGKLGQALGFDGSSSNVNLNNPVSLQLSQGTVSAWIKTSNAGTSYRGIVGKNSAYGMYLMGNIFGVYDNGAALFRSTGVNLADNKWHHVSFSFDSGVTNGTLLYIDGALSLTTTLTNTNQTGTARVGMGQGGAGQTFTGSIDEARIYNRILSANEIKQLYLMGK